MKRLQSGLLLVALVLLALLFSCKKNNDSEVAKKDYSIFFKGKVWAGELQYEGSTAEPYSITFDNSDGFTWEEYSGEYAGKYMIDAENKELTISFASGSEVIAKITDDGKLSEFTTNTTYGWKLLNSELDTMTLQVLDNTIWRGTQGEGEQDSLRFDFHSGSKADIRIVGAVLGTELPYERKAGAQRCIYYHSSEKWEFFSVLMANNTMKGTLVRQSKTPYVLTKE